jgi:hypothetical protein
MADQVIKGKAKKATKQVSKAINKAVFVPCLKTGVG